MSKRWQLNDGGGAGGGLVLFDRGGAKRENCWSKNLCYLTNKLLSECVESKLVAKTVSDRNRERGCRVREEKEEGEKASITKIETNI